MSIRMLRSSVLLVALPLVADRPPGGDDPGEAYRACVDAAIARTQTRLLDSIELWVDHSQWENAWQVASTHYVVRTTDSLALGRELSNGMETMFGFFQQMLRPGFEPPTPLQIHVMPDVNSYNTVGNTHGAEHSSMYASFFAQPAPEKPVVALYTGNTTELGMRVTHSALHQFLDSAFPGQNIPAGVVEGLASYFSLYWDRGYGRSQVVAMINRDQLEPIAQSLASPIASTPATTLRRFLGLGVFLDYALHHREDTCNEVDAEGRMVSPGPALIYLRKTLAGQDVSADPMHEMITTRAGELDADFREFIRQ